MRVLKYETISIAVPGVGPSLWEPSLPPMVPNFTGRQSECHEIACHVTSESTRLVSIWGSPGFGKTSVAIAVGHDLRSEGLPVCWLSLRELKSKADLASKLLSFIEPSVRNHHPSFSHLCLDDQLCLLLSKFSERTVFILDNADNLLEDGEPSVKKEVIGLLKEILRRSKATIFAVTTRESLDFLNVDLQGHQSVRIRPFNEDSAKTLVKALLPEASPTDCTRILQICGLVPFAIRLMCSSISEDEAQPSQYLDEFMQSASTESIAKLLDRPDYPDEYRLQSLFELSFQRLTAQGKKALVSLSILPENFGTEVAAAVLGENNLQTKKLLHSLQSKSLLDSGVKQNSFTMHKLLQSFAKEKGENDMKDTICSSRCRLNSFYVSLFEKLNEQFLTGCSMKAFLTFYENEQILIQSLLEALSNPRTASTVIDVLVKGDLFLLSLYFVGSEASNSIDLIYDSALKAAKEHQPNESFLQLLVSKAFREVNLGAEGSTVQLLSKASQISKAEAQGKRMCYLGLNYLVRGNREDGVRHLREALQLMKGSPEQTVLRHIALQVLTTLFSCPKSQPDLNQALCNAQMECKSARDTELLLTSSKEKRGSDASGAKQNQQGTLTGILSDQPLKLLITFLFREAMKNFMDIDTEQHIRNSLHRMLTEIEREEQISTGLFNFYRNVVAVLEETEDATLHHRNRISYHEAAVGRCSGKSFVYYVHKKALADCYEDLGNLFSRKKSGRDAVKAQQRALESSIELVGEEHARTAGIYQNLATAHYLLGEFQTAVSFEKRALDIYLKLFGEEHVSIANCYHNLSSTQYSLKDFNAALDSVQHALKIRLKLFGEEHASIARCYHSLSMIQHSLGDFNAALDSVQHALNIRLKLFGEEHASIADCYHSLSMNQHSLEDFNAALDSVQHALNIRLKLFGEVHASIADCYHSLSIIHYSREDFNAAVDSEHQALNIRLKIFGEEHASTARSYGEVGAIHSLVGDRKVAIDYTQHALNIYLRLFGEEHASTADSYFVLGIDQQFLGDFSAALSSFQHAHDIRLKLFGEEHAFNGYLSLFAIQFVLGDFTAATESAQQAIHIGLPGKEHANTAETCDNFGVTQDSLSDLNAALELFKPILHLFAKKQELGITDSQLPHALGELAPSLLLGITNASRSFFQINRASIYNMPASLGANKEVIEDLEAEMESLCCHFNNCLKLCGEESKSATDSHYNLGTNQQLLGDIKAALGSLRQVQAHLLPKLFGEESAATAAFRDLIGKFQNLFGDCHAALNSN